MCVKILKENEEVEYDINKPLEQQIKGYKQVVVDYEPGNPQMEKFLDEIERLCQSGVNRSFNIKVNHYNQIGGLKVKKACEKFERGCNLNDVIKALATCQKEVDEKLEEISDFCRRK